MNDTTSLTSPTAHQGLAINHIAAPSRGFLHIRMGFSPRANVAFSFLRSLEWLRTKLQASFSHRMPAQASSPAWPDYRRR
jgi:hypothetical protein